MTSVGAGRRRRRGRGPRRWRGTSARPAGSTSRSRHAERVGDHRAHRVQERRAVRVDDALRVAGGAARVAHRRGPVLVRRRANSTGSARGQQRPRSRARAAAVGDLGTSPAVVHHDDVPHGLERVEQRPRAAPSSERSTKIDLVLGVVDDVGELLGEQPDVERVQHPAACTAPRSTARGGGRCSRRRWPPGRRRRCPRSSSTPPSRRVRSAHSP